MNDKNLINDLEQLLKVLKLTICLEPQPSPQIKLHIRSHPKHHVVQAKH